MIIKIATVSTVTICIFEQKSDQRLKQPKQLMVVVLLFLLVVESKTFVFLCYPGYYYRIV